MNSLARLRVRVAVVVLGLALAVVGIGGCTKPDSTPGTPGQGGSSPVAPASGGY